MTQRHSSDQESGQQEHQQEADDTDHEPVTLEMLKAEEGLGPAADLSDWHVPCKHRRLPSFLGIQTNHPVGGNGATCHYVLAAVC